jgi:hypothetical protein
MEWKYSAGLVLTASQERYLKRCSLYILSSYSIAFIPAIKIESFIDIRTVIGG